jgi:hypothetical protein
MTIMTEADMRTELAELRAERDALLEQIAGDPELSLYFYQRKATRQRRALDALNRKVVSQRFVLRTLESLGRSLTAEEYRQARDNEPEQLRDRIEEPAK